MEYILVGTIIGGIIWGIVVNKVIENKGYNENWFWWGFFFGIFALIVALTKQNVNTTKVVIESSAPIKENMELLSSCILNNQVNISSPVHIASWEIKKDTEKLVLFVDFINVSHKAISAVMFSATGFNSFGDIVRVNNEAFFDVIGQDLSIKSNGCGKVYTTLQDDAIRKVELKVKKVCFADGTIVNDIQDEWINTNQSELKSIHIDCARRENAQSKYYAIIKEHYWQCVCGFINTQNTCAICGMQKNNALKFTQDNIDDTYNEYLKQIETEKIEEEKRKLEEKRLEEEQQAQKEERKRIIRKKAIIISTIVLISIVVISTLSVILTPIIKYNYANKLLKNGEYDIAITNFEEIIKYKDSTEKIKECQYKKAIYLYKNNEIPDAKKLLSSIIDYKDASDWIEFLDIIQLEENGELNKASEKFNSLLNTDFGKKNAELIQEHISLCDKYKIYCGKWSFEKSHSNNIGFDDDIHTYEYNSWVTIKGKEVNMKIDDSSTNNEHYIYNSVFREDLTYTYNGGEASWGGYYEYTYTFSKDGSELVENRKTSTVPDDWFNEEVRGWRVDETAYYKMIEKY